MKLYYAETINPRKACAVARYLNAPVEFVRVDLAKRGTAQARIPRHQSQWQGAGAHRRREDALGNRTPSCAISPGPPVRNRGRAMPTGRSRSCAGLAGTLSTSRARRRPLFPTHHPAIRPPGRPHPKAVEEATGFFRQCAAVLNDHLKGRKYLLGDS